jgi:hypothetical protein
MPGGKVECAAGERRREAFARVTASPGPFSVTRRQKRATPRSGPPDCSGSGAPGYRVCSINDANSLKK